MPRGSRNSQETAELVTNEQSASEGSSSAPREERVAQQPSPEFLATVIAAVKSALQESGPLLPNLQPSINPSGSATSGENGVAASCLESQVNSLQSSGAPPCFASTSSATNVSDSQGRFSTLVPNYVNTFSQPMSTVPEASTQNFLPGHESTQVSCNSTRENLVNILHNPQSTPLFQQPFIVGPGYSPVPFKLVSQCLAGKFVDLAELLAANPNEHEAESQVLFDGRLVLAAPSKKPRRQITDIVQWLEAFTVYMMIIASRFPNRWTDLTQYKLLILRTFRQYAGKVWLSYDRAFREQAAATKMVDWSKIDVQLFNFHAAGASIKNSVGFQNSSSDEPRGNQRSVVHCTSWNYGKCLAPYANCKFAHTCTRCSGDHRSVDCADSSRDKRRASSPRTQRHKKR